MIQDLKFAARSLLKSPGFTAVAVLTLALGIGANTAIFSLVKSVLIQPLPYPDPDRLVVLWQDLPGFKGPRVSSPDLRAWRNDNRTFTAIGGFRSGQLTLTGEEAPERLESAHVSAGFFGAMGLPMTLGRAFTAQEDVAGAQPLAVLSHAFWMRRFSGDRGVIGRTLTLEGEAYSIIGVLPPEYRFLEGDPQVWTQLRRNRGEKWQWAFQELRTFPIGTYALGRMKPGITLQQALRDLKRIGAQMQPQEPELGTAHGETLRDMRANGVASYRQGLLMLLCAVGAVLLIACANVGGLLLARAVTRQGELAMRATLGGSPARLVRELLMESVLLAGAGGLLGLGFAFAVRKVIVAFKPVDAAAAALFENVQVDGSVLLVTFALSALTVVLCGLWPAWKASRPDLRAVLQAGARGGSADRGSLRAREGLLIVQVALTVVLLTGAGLLLKSLAHAQAANLGFDPRGVLTAKLELSAYLPDTRKARVFTERVLARVAAVPGVQSVALAGSAPFYPHTETPYAIEGKQQTLPAMVEVVDGAPYPQQALHGQSLGQQSFAQKNFVTDGYFRTLGIPLLRGRAFGPQDVPDGQLAVIIDQTSAEQLWPGRDPIGQRLYFNRAGGPPSIVVGVVPTVRTQGYAVQPDLMQAYQSARPYPAPISRLLVRTDRDPAALAGSLRRAVLEVDPNQPLYDLSPLEDRVGDTLWTARLYSFLLAVFSLLALLLAAIGLYGALAFQVAGSTREFGIRMALGSLRGHVLGLVMKRGIRIFAVGAIAGVAGAWFLGRMFDALLYETRAFDPLIVLGVVAVTALVTAAASYLPARRATRVDPMVALRTE